MSWLIGEPAGFVRFGECVLRFVYCFHVGCVNAGLLHAVEHFPCLGAALQQLIQRCAVFGLQW